MRRILLLALAMAILAAGCASSNNTNNGANGGNNSTSGGGMGNMSMMTQLKTDTHDFSTCAAPPPAPVACATSVALPAGGNYTMYNLTVEWSTSTPAPGAVVQGIQVKVGTLTCTLPDGPFTGAPKCAKPGTLTTAPTKIEYSGAGPVTAKVTVSAG